MVGRTPWSARDALVPLFPRRIRRLGEPAMGPGRWPGVVTVLGYGHPATAPLRSRLSKLLQTCNARYRAATAKERLRSSTKWHRVSTAGTKRRRLECSPHRAHLDVR